MKTRSFAAAGAALVLALGVLISPGAPRADPVIVFGARIPLYFDHPDDRRAGSLIYRGGLLLASPDKGFGGWSDIAVSADGGIFLLERRFSLAGGVGMEIRHIAAAELHEGARLEGEVLANLSFQDTNIDNMEGIAVRRGKNGETFLYLIADNNYSPLQRTVLLMFELKPN